MVKVSRNDPECHLSKAISAETVVQAFKRKSSTDFGPSFLLCTLLCREIA